MLQLLAGGRDAPAAQALAGDVRLAYEEIVRGREHAAVADRGRPHVRNFGLPSRKKDPWNAD